MAHVDQMNMHQLIHKFQSEPSDWDNIFLLEATLWSRKSHDTQTQCGCVIVKNQTPLSEGYNGFVRGIDDTVLPRVRPAKYPFMIHAEANCLSLLKQGEAKLLAVSYMPCSYCATMIASYRIPKVVYKNVYELDTQATKIFDFYDIELIKL